MKRIPALTGLVTGLTLLWLFSASCARRAVVANSPAAPLSVSAMVEIPSAPKNAQTDGIAMKPGAPATAEAGPESEADNEANDQPGEALGFFIAQRAPDGKNIPVERLAAAQKHSSRMRETSVAAGRPLGHSRFAASAANADGSSPTPGNWTSVGPANVGGMSRALVVNPQSPDTMYAGAAGGGVWKTTDAGKTWNPLTDFLATDSIRSLALDPKDPNTIYAGTGENLGVFAIRGRGIFKSTDAGQSWSLLAGTEKDANFFFTFSIVVSPNDSNHVYAATSTGVHFSADGGNTWTRTLDRVAPNTGCEELAIRSDQSTDYLFAACGRFSIPASAIFRNVDAGGGGAWENVLAMPGMGRTSLAVAPSQPNTIYALLTDADPSSDFYQGALGVFRSDSSGDAGSWQAKTSQKDSNRVNRTLLSNPRSSFADICTGGTADYGGQGFHDNVITVDPLNPNRVWAGGVDIFRSDDGGDNWGIAMFWEAGAPLGAHADNHRLVFHPNYDGNKNQTLFNSSDGGIFMTANANADVSTGTRAACSPYPTKVAWKNLNAGFSVTQFYDGVLYPGANQYLAGAQDNGTLWGADGFGAKSWILFRGGDGGSVMLNPKDPNEMYTNYVYLSLARSIDGGNSSVAITKGITEPNASSNFLFIAPVNMDPNEPKRIYIGGRGLWRSENRGDNWQRSTTLTTSSQGRISAIAVSPLDSNVVFYGTEFGYVFHSDKALTTDDTTAWDFARPRSSGYVARIAFDPVDINTAYVVYRTYKGSGQNYVYKTSDQGATWTAIDGSDAGALPDAPVHSIVVDPQNNQTLYLGTELGVFTSTDGGNSWLRDSNNFANTPVTQLILDRSAGTTNLVAFTFGRGVWKTALPGSGSGCTYTLSTAPPLPGNSGEMNVTVDTARGCSWALTPISTFLYAKSPAVGTGPGAATIYGSWNVANTARNGLIAIADKSVTVSQKAIGNAVGNDDTAARVDATPYFVALDSRQYTSDDTDPVHSCTGTPDYKTAWWTFTAPSDGTAEIATQGRRYDIGGNSGIVLTVYDTSRSNTTELACTMSPRNQSSYVTSTVRVPVKKGKVYQIELSATGNTAVDGGYSILSVLMK